MRYIKVVLLVLIFFLFAVFVVQNHAVLGQDVAFHLNLFVLPPFESIPLPLYFVMLMALLLGALVCVLFLAGDRIKITFALRRARKKINTLEREVAQLRAIPLTGNAYKALDEMKPQPGTEAEKPAEKSTSPDKATPTPTVIAAGPAASEQSQSTTEAEPAEDKPDVPNNQPGDRESGSVDKL